MPKSGRARKNIGVTLIILGVVLVLVLRFVPESEINELVIFLSFLAPVIIAGGAFFFWRSRQLAARDDVQRILSDEKPDVLYLRTFGSDASTAGNVFGSLLTARLLSGLASDEEQLAEVLRPIGDMVAIGRPGERLPTPGAARIYAADDEWKGVVARQMQSSRLVVIRAGVGENLLWELEHAVSTLDPAKLLILFLYMKKKDYEAFRAAMKPILGADLPATAAVLKMRRVSGFIGFARDWKQPRFYSLSAPYFRKSVYKPNRRLFTFALKPVFEGLGVKWREPPVSALTVTAVSLLAVMLLLVLAVFVGVIFS